VLGTGLVVAIKGGARVVFVEKCFLAGGESGQGHQGGGEHRLTERFEGLCVGHERLPAEMMWKTKNSVPRVITAHCSGERRELFF